MKKYSSKKTFGFLFVWVIVATALGVYLVNTLTKPNNEDKPAPLAGIHQCGPRDINPEDQQKILSEWTVKIDKLSTDARKALAANIKTLPQESLLALKKHNLKVTLDRGDVPYNCQVFDTPSGKKTSNVSPTRTAQNCLKILSKNSLALIIGRPALETPDGKPRFLRDDELIDEYTTPTLFWALLEGLHKLADNPVKKLGASDPSIQNISENVKRYIVGAYNISLDEQEHYLRRFGAAGTGTPTFITRTLVLTASNLYCSKESFERLSKSQPIATQRFMSIYGCTLGKPWHLADGEFSKFCSNLATAK